MNTKAGAKRKWAGVGAVLVLLAGGLVFERYGRSIWVPVLQKIKGQQTVDDVMARYGAGADARLRPHFGAAGVSYPPHDIMMLGIKEDATLELWARETSDDPYALIHTYPIKAASGILGPKLRQGDKQVPEGVYNIEGLNPNSSYHLSMKLDYPNAFDLARAAEDHRHSPGSNIFIHGKALSVGCLAMGDPAIEELFVLIAHLGVDQSQVIIAPRNPRHEGWDTPPPGSPGWTRDLYVDIERALSALPLHAGG